MANAYPHALPVNQPLCVFCGRSQANHDTATGHAYKRGNVPLRMPDGPVRPVVLKELKK